MAVHQLLLRGMLVGLIAGILAFGFARVFGEPAVERAIAFESASHHEQDAGHHHETAAAAEAEDPEFFSRGVQANTGLLIGQVVYASALGGLFALLFAIVYGRLGRMSPKGSAALLALLCFVAVFAVPYLKYPANPPAVGQATTIGIRTGLYFSMIAISVVAMMTAFSLKRLAEPRLGTWNATLVGVIVFVGLAGAAALMMPTIDEVPANFPAATLWQFRMSTLGIQAILWSVIGLLFGVLTERQLQAQ